MPDFRIDRSSDLPSYRSPQLMSQPRLRHGFFTRLGGVSQGMYESLNFRFSGSDSRENVMQNFRLAAQSLGEDETRVVRTVQAHGDHIVVAHPVTELTAAGEQVDALITNEPHVVLTGFYADCQLILLYDRHTRSCGLAHVGWRGAACEVLPKTIRKMTAEFGVRPSDLIAAVGPSICRSCFETDDDVPEALNRTYGEAISDYMYREGDKWHVDLKNITYMALVREGVLPMNIDISNECTCCGDKRLFWSHRRQGDARGVHAGMIVME